MKDMGEPKLKIVAMPKDTNSAGNIFGGWILSQIDSAGAIAARELSPERVVTISMEQVVFKQPVFVGDVISCYAKVVKVGTTSIKVQVEVVAQRSDEFGCPIFINVTSATVTYVSVDARGNKKPIREDLKRTHGF
ncbi:acyl-CoA thioesterase [Campylobacter estrildidarum]|uniref:Acyl-CoA thioesterase n=1 Tax=Campylobacter estrildidarum TaxID=2510189 RepID=A0A4U7BGU5_9BACT|nr:acyl-CoA thioesterase [Campylobacter estrildidarum]TKX30983.1 acyl-CoA thioesterase [Campylobacter estrildidarum]